MAKVAPDIQAQIIDADFRTILEAGRLSPTSFGHELMRAGSDHLQRRCREVKRLPEDAIAFLDAAHDKVRKHDHRIAADREIADWSGKQADVVLANMMTAAAPMGIDSCPMEGFEMDRTAQTLQEHFGIDATRWKPAVMVAFGCRAKDPEFARTRRSMDDTVAWF